MKRLVFLITLLVSTACAPSFSQAVIEIDDAINQRDFMPYELPFYVDATNQLSFWEISSNSFSNRFKQHPDYQNKDFQPNAAYWIRLPIKSNPNSHKVWLLEFYDQTIDHIEAYIPHVDGSFRRDTKEASFTLE